ncbi:MAG: Histidine triad (HIT) protein [Candidatus Magasanikbacteria bacterium GW2011_GWA2_37_8]|uniref:Histidine triad (HIT) protein n=1 Tax=Candidatus Magasanikbacteria bacterium GW2011_GWA2_37_8 TaxID=1619036 RepID=A0A0G0HCX4_9BACT|nr:MAG: Histidine triad (HIT) protein [Candidatus Magasanikbacteria bacterium GW2011_GWA2_37_8]
MLDCIFCKIVNKEIPNYTVYEDDFVLAFLDIFPHAQGHTVVIPKKHYDNFLSLTNDEAKLLITGVQNAMQKIQTTLNPDGFNVGWNENPAGGQVVPHLHVHIFPRYQGDGGSSVHSIIKNSGNKTPKEVFELFK